MTRKAQILNDLIMAIVMTIVCTVEGQILTTGGVNMASLTPSLALGTVIGFLLAHFTPLAKLGAALAIKMGMKPGSFGFAAVIAFVLGLVIGAVQTYLMTIFGATVLGGAPLMAAVSAATGALLPILATAVAACIIIVMPTQAICMKLFPAEEQTKRAA